MSIPMTKYIFLGVRKRHDKMTFESKKPFKINVLSSKICLFLSYDKVGSGFSIKRQNKAFLLEIQGNSRVWGLCISTSDGFLLFTKWWKASISPRKYGIKTKRCFCSYQPESPLILTFVARWWKKNRIKNSDFFTSLLKKLLDFG